MSAELSRFNYHGLSFNYELRGDDILQYREFGKLNFRLSTLGFGCMRLPVKEGESGERATMLDEEASIKLIRHAIDKGVNYFDTAYTYNQGLSEVVLGKALKDGYREKVKIGTKIPLWQANSHEELYEMFNEELRRLDTDYIDMYLLHMLSHMNWDMVEKLRVFEFLNCLRKNGKIKYVGFSFHDGFHLLKTIIDAYDWDFCYLQMNYLDENYQAGLKGVRYANKKGLAVVAMEPLRGGGLVNNVPNEIQNIWNQSQKKRTPAEWAFRWVCNHPEISVILSGMNTMLQLNENLSVIENAYPSSLTREDLNLIGQVKEAYKEKIKVNCTQCNYCMPCPQGVFIRGIFNFYNNASLFNKIEEALNFYNRMKKMKRDISVCTGCRRCEKLCPQQIPITKYLKEAHDAFEDKLSCLEKNEIK